MENCRDDLGKYLRQDPGACFGNIKAEYVVIIVQFVDKGYKLGINGNDRKTLKNMDLLKANIKLIDGPSEEVRRCVATLGAHKMKPKDSLILAPGNSDAEGVDNDTNNIRSRPLIDSRLAIWKQKQKERDQYNTNVLLEQKKQVRHFQALYHEAKNEITKKDVEIFKLKRTQELCLETFGNVITHSLKQNEDFATPMHLYTCRELKSVYHVKVARFMNEKRKQKQPQLRDIEDLTNESDENDEEADEEADDQDVINSGVREGRLPNPIQQEEEEKKSVEPGQSLAAISGPAQSATNKSSTGQRAYGPLLPGQRWLNPDEVVEFAEGHSPLNSPNYCKDYDDLDDELQDDSYWDNPYKHNDKSRESDENCNDKARGSDKEENNVDSDQDVVMQ